MMTLRRTLVLSATAVASVAPLLLAVPAAPAQGHGAPTSPISRSAACGPEGGSAASSPACRAAKAAGIAADQWDNIRVANVDGRDRERIPDGELCSGGLATFAGLDLPRDDWPATRLTPGAEITLTYRGTIPHKGTFRVYVTTPDYTPTKPLTWDDLESKPFLTVTDPTLRAGSYRIPGTLPTGLSGRHLLYTVWQNSSTPDTYYSCSDVIFNAPNARSTANAGDSASGPDSGGTSTGRPTAKPTAGSPDPPSQPVAAVSGATAESHSRVWSLVGIGAVILAALLAIVGGRRRASRQR